MTRQWRWDSLLSVLGDRAEEVRILLSDTQFQLESDEVLSLRLGDKD